MFQSRQASGVLLSVLPPMEKFKQQHILWNSNCKSSGPLSLLPLADYKTIGSITNCPSLRLCPKCGIPIEHTRDCKRMECAICAKVFCFICLADWSSDIAIIVLKHANQLQCRLLFLDEHILSSFNFFFFYTFFNTVLLWVCTYILVTSYTIKLLI